MSRLPRHCRPLGGAFNPADFQQRLLWVQAVWKRFSYPNNCKQQGVMDLDATG
jgi:hypothetical protein